MGKLNVRLFFIVIFSLFTMTGCLGGVKSASEVDDVENPSNEKESDGSEEVIVDQPEVSLPDTPQNPNPVYSGSGGTVDGKPLSSIDVCSYNNTTCDRLKDLFAVGMAAGNLNDWYENRDSNHSLVNIVAHPQVRRLANEGYAVSFAKYADKNVIGNASLGSGGQWNMIRNSHNYQTFLVQKFYEQYRDNDHFWYPGVYDFKKGSPEDFDERYSMSTYESSSLGKSGSDRNKVHKFFYAMAALRPGVKKILEDNGMLIPTIQMVFRRTRVDTDQEYLSSQIAHASAFDDAGSSLDLVNLANSIQPSNIPPLIDISVERDDFISSKNQNRLFYQNKTEHLYTTKGSVARVYRELGAREKKMVIDLSGSLDLNNRTLTFETKIIRGNSSHIIINKLNASGSKVEIIFKPKAVGLLGVEQRTSNLFVVGVFANNGVFYSAPGFITVQNETSLEQLDWTAVDNKLEITRSTRGVNNVTAAPIWNGEVFYYDSQGDLDYFERLQSGSSHIFNKYGLRVIVGSPNPTVNETNYIEYTKYSRQKVKTEDACTDYRKSSAFSIINKVSTGGAVTCGVPPENTNTIISNSLNGSVSSSLGIYRYTPNPSFEGRDYFLIRSDNAATMESSIMACDILVN